MTKKEYFTMTEQELLRIYHSHMNSAILSAENGRLSTWRKNAEYSA